MININTIRYFCHQRACVATLRVDGQRVAIRHADTQFCGQRSPVAKHQVYVAVHTDALGYGGVFAHYIPTSRLHSAVSTGYYNGIAVICGQGAVRNKIGAI